MKIKDLISELIDPEIKSRNVSNKFNLDKMAKRSKRGVSPKSGGEGAYAVGIPDPTDPFMFRKKSKMPSILDNDGYYQWVMAIKPYIGDNPVLPRVYVVDIKKDPRGLSKPEYKMEKLISIYDATTQYGSGSIAKYFAKKYLGIEDDLGYSLYDFIDKVAKNIEKEIPFKNKHLNQAAELIKETLKKQPFFELDMHAGNVMIRTTPTGPEFVITDPIHDSGRSIIGPFNPFGQHMVNMPPSHNSHKNIIKDPMKGYFYALDVIGDRWPEAEPYIMQRPMVAYLYAKNVIGDRWPEAEPYIMQSTRAHTFYKKHFNIED